MRPSHLKYSFLLDTLDRLVNKLVKDSSENVSKLIRELKLKIIATNRLNQALIEYPNADKSLRGWYQIISQGEFYSETALRATFGDMRGYNYEFKFPIPDSALLVHTLINFESQVAYIDHIHPGNH